MLLLLKMLSAAIVKKLTIFYEGFFRKNKKNKTFTRGQFSKIFYENVSKNGCSTSTSQSQIKIEILLSLHRKRA